MEWLTKWFMTSAGYESPLKGLVAPLSRAIRASKRDAFKIFYLHALEAYDTRGERFFFYQPKVFNMGILSVSEAIFHHQYNSILFVIGSKLKSNALALFNQFFTLQCFPPSWIAGTCWRVPKPTCCSPPRPSPLPPPTSLWISTPLLALTSSIMQSELTV